MDRAPTPKPQLREGAMATQNDRSNLLERLNLLGGQIRNLALVTAFARLLAWWLPVLVFLASVDWCWDLFEEVPRWGRILLTTAAWGSLAALAFKFLPSATIRPKAPAVASLVERHWPELEFRLVTVAQVADTRPFALQVAGEASRLALGQDWWSKVLDSRPLRLTLLALLPVAGAIRLFSALQPETAYALTSRLTRLDDTPVPRATIIGGETFIHSPQGEAVQVVFSWAGRPPANGLMRWRGTDGQRIEIPLEVAEGQLLANIPAEAGDGTMRVWAGDGRHGPSLLRRQVRPVPVLSSARALLPAWRGTTPSGKRFAIELADGEAEALAGSEIEVAFEAGTPLADCQLTVVPNGDSARPRVATGKVDGSAGMVSFTLAGGDSRYEVQAVSREGLMARPPLARRCRPLPEDPPQVAWLAEHVTGANAENDDDIDGLPVVIGTQFRVAYRASSPAGIARAEFHYRIQNKTDWRVIKLAEVAAKPAWGSFDARRGLFSRQGGQIFDFYAPTSTEPEKIPGRSDAWGRFDFHIEGLAELRLADRIEYKVVAQDLRPRPLSGESETRVKEVVGVDELLAWLRRREREQEKLRQLRLDQLGVFPDRPASRSGS